MATADTARTLVSRAPAIAAVFLAAVGALLGLRAVLEINGRSAPSHASPVDVHSFSLLMLMLADLHNYVLLLPTAAAIVASALLIVLPVPALNAAGEILRGRIVSTSKNWQEDALRSFVELFLCASAVWHAFMASGHLGYSLACGVLSCGLTAHTVPALCTALVVAHTVHYPLPSCTLLTAAHTLSRTLHTIRAPFSRWARAHHPCVWRAARGPSSSLARCAPACCTKARGGPSHLIAPPLPSAIHIPIHIPSDRCVRVCCTSSRRGSRATLARWATPHGTPPHTPWDPTLARWAPN
jgi:hypothetical protein